MPSLCWISSDSGSGCPGSTVDLTLTADCQPDCEDLSFSLVKSVPDLTVNLPGGTGCAGSPHDLPYTVDIAPDAPAGDITFEIVGQTSEAECSTLVTLNVTPITATMTALPAAIPASTAWPGMPNFSFSEIGVQWDPPDCEGTVEIAELIGNYQPPGPGSLTWSNTAEVWIYTAFSEPMAELHPQSVEVWIAAKQSDTELDRVRVNVLPVHNWWVTPHQHGPFGQFHAPNEDDYWNDYAYIRWKYFGVLNGIAGAGFDVVEISETDCVPCGGNPCAFACTQRLPFVGDSVSFGRNTFSGSENQAASIVGHELYHTTGEILLTSECAAYTWELDHQIETGIDQDIGYLDDVQQKQQQECNP